MIISLAINKLSNDLMNLSGETLIIINAFFISLLYVVVKILINDFHYSSSQIGVLYKISVLIIILLSCLGQQATNELKTKKISLHILRGFLSIGGSLCMFHSISKISVVHATAISELTPLIMVIIGVFVFNEKMNKQKIILLTGSTIGIFFIKDFSSIRVNSDSGYLFAFLALIFWSMNNMVIKKLTRTEDSRAQLFYSSLFASMFTFPVACFRHTIDFTNYSVNIHLANWPEFSCKTVPLIILAGISSLIHKLCFFQAYKVSDISVVGPFDYLRLPFAGFFAYIFLGEFIIDSYSLFGYSLILLSGVYFIINKNN